MKCNDVKPLFMDYLYDEISDEDKSLFLAHLSQCQSCQKELESLEKTSHILQQWEDADPDFNVVRVTEKVPWLRHLKERWFQLTSKPGKIALGLVYAAVVIFLLLAMANTEISYRNGEFQFSSGLFSKPALQQKTADDLYSQQLLEKLQRENYLLVNTLIQQSEARQKKELTSALIQFRQDIERQRVEDLNLVGYGLDNIERKTFRQIRRTDNSLNELIRLISTQEK